MKTIIDIIKRLSTKNYKLAKKVANDNWLKLNRNDRLWFVLENNDFCITR